MELIKKILIAHRKSIFDIKDSKFVAEIVHYSIREEVLYTRGNIGRDLDEKIAWQHASK